MYRFKIHTDTIKVKIYKQLQLLVFQILKL